MRFGSIGDGGVAPGAVPAGGGCADGVFDSSARRNSQRILAGRVCHLVEEALEREAERVAARGPERAGGNAQRHHRRVEREVRQVARGELGVGHVRGRRELLDRTEGDEVVPEAGQRPAGVETGGERVVPAGPVDVVLEVVLAGPEKLHRDAGLAGDPRPPRPGSRCTGAARTRRRRG